MSLYIAIAPDDLQRLAPLVRLLIELFLSTNTKSGETPADDAGLKVPVLMLLDEFLSLGRIEKLVHALAYVSLPLSMSFSMFMPGHLLVGSPTARRSLISTQAG